jgi:hypothetical protein
MLRNTDDRDQRRRRVFRSTRLQATAAGGTLTPNERNRFDIYPAPRIGPSAFVMGNSWCGSVGADIGGGSWTIERTSGLNERRHERLSAFAGFSGWTTSSRALSKAAMSSIAS